MRIALFSWEALYAVPVGGVAAHVSHMAAALRRAGHEVHIFTRLGSEQRLYDNVFGVHYHRCPFDSCENFIDEMRGMCDSFLHYFENVTARHGRFDLVQCHDWMSFGAGVRLKTEQQLPLAVTFHTTEWGRSGVWPESPQAKRITEIEQLGVDAADTVIAVSLEVRRQVDQLYHCPDWKKEIVYYGIDCKLFDATPFDAGAIKTAAGLDPMAPMVLFVGALSHRKGPDLLLQAAATVRNAHPDARFVFVGEGELREHLERERERLGLQEAVLFFGTRGGKELIDLYRACDVVCSPSRSDPFGIVTLSAWAAGKPVVATVVGAPGEIIKDEDTGFLVEGTPGAVAAGLLKAFSDFEHLRWMGRNGRVAVETAFTWDVVAEKTMGVYERSVRMRKQNTSIPATSDNS